MVGEGDEGRGISRKKFKHAGVAEKQNITAKQCLKLSLIMKRKLEWGRLGKPQSGPRIRTSIVNHKHIQVNESYIMRSLHHVM